MTPAATATLTIATALLLSACEEAPATSPEKVFTQDGCTICRFKDRGYWHYFARCRGGNAVTFGETPERCGKSTCPQTATVEAPQ